MVRTASLWIHLHVTATYFTCLSAKYLRHSCYSLSHFEDLLFTNMHMNGYTGRGPRPLTRTPAITEATAFLRSPQSMHSHSGQRKLSRKPAMGALLPAHLLLRAGEPLWTQALVLTLCRLLPVNQSYARVSVTSSWRVAHWPLTGFLFNFVSPDHAPPPTHTHLYLFSILTFNLFF